MTTYAIPKPFLILSVGLTLVLSGVCSAAAAAVQDEQAAEKKKLQLLISSRELTPQTTIELRFPTLMVPEGEVGEAAQEVPLKSTPKWKGTFIWRSQRSGVFEPLEKPKPGQRYEFRLRKGLVDLSGNAVERPDVPDGESAKEEGRTAPNAPRRVRLPGETGKKAEEGEMWEAVAPHLKRLAHHPAPAENGYHVTSREPDVLVIFNDAIDPAVARKSLYFSDRKRWRTPARVRAARFGEIPQIHHDLQPWEHRLADDPVPPGDDEPVPFALVATPLKPLPPGEVWELVVEAGLPNTEGSSHTQERGSIYVGAVPGLKIVSTSAVNQLDVPKHVTIVFNKPLHESLTQPVLDQWVECTPEPDSFEVTLTDDKILVLNGDFQVNRQYALEILPGMLAEDETILEEGVNRPITFSPQNAYLSLPAFDASQLSTGRNTFEAIAANMESVTIKVKEVEPDNLLYALRGYRTYGRNPNTGKKSGGARFRIPYDVLAGQTVYEKTFVAAEDAPFDISEKHVLSWPEILGDKPVATLFVSVEGVPRKGVLPTEKLASQSLLQLTDIGLAWKWAGEDALVFAFSHSTGKALPGVKISVRDDNGRLLEEKETTADGVTHVAKTKESAWLLAETEGDRHAVRFGTDIGNLPLWQTRLPVEWTPPSEFVRQTYVFSDRPLYQPGETFNLKCLSRFRAGEQLEIPAEDQRRAVLKVIDPKSRVIEERTIALNANGTYTQSIVLPDPAPLGAYTATLTFKRPLSEEELAEYETKHGEPAKREARFADERPVAHHFRVEKFKPNTFKLAFDEDLLARRGDQYSVRVAAEYLMGKPLSKAQINWLARVGPQPFQPDGFEAFAFGDSRSATAYDGRGQRRRTTSSAGSIVVGNDQEALSAQGDLVLEFTVPEQADNPGPRSIAVSAEVTDINQQTVAGQIAYTAHSSDFYIGIGRFNDIVRTYQSTPVRLTVVNADGTRPDGPVEAKVLVEHLSWSAVRVKSAGGGTRVKNHLIREAVLETAATIQPLREKQQGPALVFNPERPGTYHITVTAEDAAGRPVKSSTSIDAYGHGWASWRHEDGNRIDLAPDQPRYRPGDTAKVMIKTSVKGTALVTVEGRELHRHFLTEVVENSHVVEIPIEEDFAPNVFVSVILVRGALADEKKFKQPDWKLGYCQLEVANVRDQLVVEPAPSKQAYRPGQQVVINTTVRDGRGEPVPNAELTLYAVDEGVLGLTGYENPDPFPRFHGRRPLGVRSDTTLDGLLPENPQELGFWNKGFVIGGGDGDAEPQLRMTKLRKNFKASAFWDGALVTGGDGMVSVSFKAPDNLTDFRVVAVANEGARKFGAGQASFKVNKPLMLEPAVPQIARVGDHLRAAAVVHNTSAHAGKFEISLGLDDHAQLVAEDEGEEPAPKVVIELQPGETRHVVFPVAFVAPGESTWKWRAVATDAQQRAELVDVVRSRTLVDFATPEVREVRFATLTRDTNNDDLLDGVDPALLEGQGEIILTLSNSRLGEAKGAIEQILKYPYGCVEQTTSSTLPWIALRDLHGVLPMIKRPAEEVEASILKGCERLLTMQTRSGGLAYWPGGLTANLWGSAYAGMGLALAQRSGTELPQPRLDALAAYLSESLRNASRERGTAMTDRCFAAYTLVLLGKPEEAYINTLYQQRRNIPLAGRTFLALAILESGADKDMARVLIDDLAEAQERSPHWLGPVARLGSGVVAWCRLEGRGAQAEALVDALMKQRSSRRGDWLNTYNNAWAMLALAAHATAEGGETDVQECVVRLGDRQEELTFPQEAAGREVRFAFADLPIDQALQVTLHRNQTLYGFIEVRARKKDIVRNRVQHGMAIVRSYDKIGADGSLSEAEDLVPGDMVLVTLKMDVPGSSRYIAIDDPLPAIFEAVNPNFQSKAAEVRQKQERLSRMTTDFHELRTDRTLFFRNQLSSRGRYVIHYLARVVGRGTVAAPPAKIEAMYDPELYGLSSAILVSAK